MTISAERTVTISSVTGRAANRLSHLLGLILGWSQSWTWRTALYRSRRDLAGLSDAQLRDIGVTRDEAAAEARRGFGWR